MTRLCPQRRSEKLYSFSEFGHCAKLPPAAAGTGGSAGRRNVGGVEGSE
jgi:hypothetical protein